MTDVSEKRQALVDYLEAAAPGATRIEPVGAHGVTVVARSIPAAVLAVEDRGPNGAVVVDVSHHYSGFDDAGDARPMARVTVGWS